MVDPLFDLTVVCGALFLLMGSRFARSGKFMPAGMGQSSDVLLEIVALMALLLPLACFDADSHCKFL